MIDGGFDADGFNRFEAAGWEERAHAYHRFVGPITARVIDPLLDAAQIVAGSRVLDVGTGPGDVAAAALARGARVIGVDVANEMVALARRAHPDIEFRQADAERLPFEDGSFDALVGNFVILHLGRPEQAASEFTRVLTSGGRAALSTWDAPERGRLGGLFAQAVAEVGAPPPATIPPGPSFFRFSDDAEFTRLLAGVGLREVNVRTVSFNHGVATVDELWDGMLDGTVRIRAMVLGQREQTLSRIRATFDRLVAEYADERGYAIPVSVRLGSGRKP